MDYLITGGAGFIGSNIAEHLVGRGCRVRVFDNFSTGKRANVQSFATKAEIFEGDLCDPRSIEEAVRGVRYVLHLGAIPSVPRSVENPQATNEVNITGTVNLLVAARDAGVKRVVFTSSSSVYGDTPTLPKRENMPPSPLSPTRSTRSPASITRPSSGGCTDSKRSRSVTSTSSARVRTRSHSTRR